MLALIGKMFAFALERDLVELNPRVGLTPPGKENPRSRFLSIEEIRVLWLQLQQITSVVPSICRFLLLTGQRCHSVLQLRHDQVSDGVWTTPGDWMKSGHDHRMFPSDQALGVLQGNRERFPDSPWGFPPRRKVGSPVVDMGRSLVDLQNACGFHFTRHDLRRTCATHMARLGCPRHVPTRVLDHADHSVTSIYDRYSYDDELREWTGKWGTELERITGS